MALNIVLGEKTMELAIALLVVVFGVWFFFFRNKEEVRESMAETPSVAPEAAPYKVETPTTPEVATPAVETAPVQAVEAPVQVTEQKVEAAPKKPKAQPKAKTAQKPKAVAKPKSTAKKPRMKVAKVTK